MHPYVHSLSETGAAASVIAVAVATTMLAPDYRIFQMLNGGIPLWIITIIFIAIDFGTIGVVNNAVAISHIASGFTGFFLLSNLKKGQ